MTDLTIIKFKVNEKFFGYPDPFIPNGSFIILIQDNNVEVCKYEEPTEENPFPTFVHPINKKEVDAEAFNLILNNYTHYLDTSESITLLCPPSLFTKAIWPIS